MKNIVIIGNGISGITAARHIRKRSNNRISVISSETKYFYSRTALMYIYMGHMKYEHTKPYEDHFWSKNKIDLIQNRVSRIDFTIKKLFMEDGSELQYDELILALGSKPNMFNWPGQNLEGVQGLYSYQDLESMEQNTRGIGHAVVVGGGLIGIEMAEMLLSRGIGVTFLVRENSFWDIVLPKEESELINRHIKSHHVDLRLSTELGEIFGDVNGKVKEVITNKGERIACEFVGLTTGVRPNIDFLKESELATNRGILVNEYFETNIQQVYAIGDCAENTNPAAGRRPIEQVWYTGRMHGEVLARTICGEKTAYKPGIWFNSAKFFDIEYQTYGDVPPTLSEGQNSFYWEHPNGERCLKIRFNKITREVVGFNVLGMRYRHEVCEQWIKNRTPIVKVMEDLGKANFDPEFFTKNERDIRTAFNQQFPEMEVEEPKRKFSLFRR